MESYQVIVIGAGHAGCEAALAASRMGAKTALVTLERTAIARMSCNPSIGGIAKSHIVCELDALGGEMGKNSDYTGIQFRTLNTKKGPAVQAFRTQCDKHAYSKRMQRVTETAPNLTIIEALVEDLWIENGALRGVVVSDGSKIESKAVILTTGTFLRGMIHIGENAFSGGRKGEPAANQLSLSLKNLGFRLGRLKTGTPPRLHKDSIDWKKTTEQPGETPPPFFSYEISMNQPVFHVEQKAEGERLKTEDRRLKTEGQNQNACIQSSAFSLQRPLLCSTWNNRVFAPGNRDLNNFPAILRIQRPKPTGLSGTILIKAPYMVE
jgi:glucose-inhibited division protein A